mmetsp:Transcript_42397/g.111624  ORF Transcript_42397/g.111624 Transcript_42397/m.111624 type:complete len:136 (-) Transcript_42397:1132-1539(-)
MKECGIDVIHHSSWQLVLRGSCAYIHRSVVVSNWPWLADRHGAVPRERSVGTRMTLPPASLAIWIAVAARTPNSSILVADAAPSLRLINHSGRRRWCDRDADDHVVRGSRGEQRGFPVGRRVRRDGHRNGHRTRW